MNLIISDIFMNGDTPYVLANGVRICDKPDSTLADLQRLACARFGVDFGAWLIQQPVIIASTIIAESFPSIAASDMDRLQSEHSDKAELVAAILAGETWMRAIRDAAITMCGEIQAGTRTSVSRADFDSVGAAPVNYFLIVALSKQ